MPSETPTGLPPIPPRYNGLADAETFGRLISKPNSIDPNAVAYFAAWIADLPGTVGSVSGAEQSGSPGEVLGLPLIVRVTDRQGRPAEGVLVLFSVRESDARIDGRLATVVRTAADGTASGRWRLGRKVGTHRVDVRAGGVRATFTAEATPGYQGSTQRLPSSSKSSGSRAS